MVAKTYQLFPYAKTSNGLKIEILFSLTPKYLSLSFALNGALDEYLFDTKNHAKRADELWKATCFEAFIKNPNTKEYWELNIASNGAWNFYHFSDYKKEMQEESRVLAPKVVFKKESDEVSVSVEVDFTENLFDKEVEFNLAVILLDIEAKRHFYTLNPKEGVADFHDFVLG